MSESEYQQFRLADTIEGVRVRTTTSANNDNGSLYYVSLQDIRVVFPDALQFKLDGIPIPFLEDPDGNRIEPARIAYHPYKILDVITEVPQFGNSNSN
ncbi:hypothetical protein BX616_005519, partial [Lobosporangium transversale]